MNGAIVIAVDGTAASGKGTVARLLARHFHFAHLDSGSLYRLTALALLAAGRNAENETDAVAAAKSIDPADANNPSIRNDAVARLASMVATIPAVRSALLDYQRQFAAHPPGNAPGAVIDGRDIGTVVCPDASAKLFVDAKPEIRAHRRWLELQASGVAADEKAVLADILARDARDRERTIAPLRPAPDAILLDTSEVGIDAALAAALALVSPRIEDALKVRHRG